MPMLPELQDPTAAATTHTETTFRFLAAPPLWVLVLVVLPATALFAWWAYGGLLRLERPTRIALSLLRWLALLIALLLVFQPAFETTTYRKTQNQVHVLIDDSASMLRKDRYPDPLQQQALASLVGGEQAVAESTRLQLVRRELERPEGLLQKLQQGHDVRLFRVQRKPVPIRGLDELTGRGNRTALGDALDLHLAAAAGSNLDAVVLVSDGRNNQGLDPVEAARAYALRGITVHTVGIGDPEAPRNAWVVGPPGPKEALREEDVGFDVALRAEGLAGKRVRLELHGARDGSAFALLTATSAELPSDGEVTRARLVHSFREAGDWTLRFQLVPLGEESQLDDNQDVRFLRVVDEKIRVLYVEERPRWEYRYVKTGLKRVDPSIQMQAVLFEASPKFEQEHSADLPPLLDLPRTEQEFLRYHCILLGDVAPERIAPTEEGRYRWLQMLVRYVEFGGGLGFLSGIGTTPSEAVMPERYRNTPLMDLLPVVLEDPVVLQRERPNRERAFRPTLENPLQPHDILLLLRDVGLNRRLWEQGLPGFYVYHPVQRAKPGATVLLRHPTDQNTYGHRPLAVIGPHPRGTTFFLATDETWRWRNPYGEIYMDAFWRNVVRHLASGRLQRRNDLLELTVDRNQLETGEKVRVVLRVHDTELQPATSAEQTIFVRNQDQQLEKRVLRPVPGEPGAYQASLAMPEPGTFSFLVFANQNPADTVLAREDVLVAVPEIELAASAQDAAALQRIAAASRGTDGSGRYVFLTDTAQLAADLASRRTFESREDTRTETVWDRASSLFALLLVLAAEWLLRKRARLV
ncbi:MAG: VWA domain-containing protein [Planctomycetes bacterium]|nr:VWA domain-containing protein [Planctomycetota bacterium]